MATRTGSSGSASSDMSGQSSGGMGMDESGHEEQTPNVTYDLISVIYHALQGCETYEMYADDAEQGGHSEIAQFFREAGQQDQERAERGQQLLMQCLQEDMGQGQGQGSRQQMQSGGRSGQMGGASGGRGTSGGRGSSMSGGGSTGSGTSGSEGSSSRSRGSGGGDSGRGGSR